MSTPLERHEQILERHEQSEACTRIPCPNCLSPQNDQRVKYAYRFWHKWFLSSMEPYQPKKYQCPECLHWWEFDKVEIVPKTDPFRRNYGKIVRLKHVPSDDAETLQPFIETDHAPPELLDLTGTTTREKGSGVQ